MKAPTRFGIAIFALLLASCAPKDETGPGEVHWDRDTCARCVMAVSDHYYSAQVRGGAPEGRTRLYFFDDVGCAVIWLDKQNWKDDPRTEIWVNDWQSGDWIDARKAWYIPGKTTPMDYGLGAQLEAAEGAYDFDRAIGAIYDRESGARRHRKMEPDTH